MVADGSAAGMPVRSPPPPPRRPGSHAAQSVAAAPGAAQAAAMPTPDSAAPLSSPPVVGTPVPGAPVVIAAAVSAQIGVASDLVGSVLADRYRILKKLGEGGMGSVYLAEHTTINKRLAIKVLSPEYSHKQDLVDRFLQEARAASMIEQENVVEITDFGSTPGGSVFFAMEFLNGEDLAATVKREGALQWPRVQAIMLQICTALDAAHAAGIIHRDMKPENCYRIRRGSNEDFIKVLDFGIAKVQSDEGEGGRGLTRTGMIFGTPEYMSPEQAKGERVDHRVDVYAAGVIMYELLTGRVPFTADTFMGILTKHMFEAPAAPSSLAPHAGIPREAEAVILKALQKDREYRFQSMVEMARAIEAVGTGAAAVSVVREHVVAPHSGQLRFAGSSTAIELDADAGAFDASPKSRAGLFVGLGVGAALLGGLVYVAISALQADPLPAPTGAQAAAAAEPPDPTPVAVGTPTPTPTPEAAPAAVQITVATPGIDGEVRADGDGRVLGRTNAAISIAKGETALRVVVHADGYDDRIIELTPDATKSVDVSLEVSVADEAPVEVKPESHHDKRGGKRGGKKDGKPDAKADPKPNATPDPKPDAKPDPKPDAKPDPKPDPKPDVKPDPKPDPKRGGGSPDLKDPFGHN